LAVVGDSLTLIDMFVRGIAVGAMATMAVSVLRSRVSRDAKIASLLAGVSLSAWLMTESHPLWAAFDNSFAIMFLALPVSSAFWLLVMVVFGDYRVTPLTLAPAALLIVSGVVMLASPPPLRDGLWVVRNTGGSLLSLHATLVIVRGWRGDLIQARRTARALMLGFGGVFGASVAILALVNRVHPMGRWMLLEAGEAYGGMIMAALAIGVGVLFLQARPSVFGAARRPELADARTETADRAMLHRLEALMAAEGWRREGLTIGQLAGELGLPEHRLRRLINHSLGHRNFADFLNAHRIEAAKRRLADPADARTTVAVIAFDLGYGSLGPFNRAFRAATGATPTEWRREALSGSPDLRDAV
jgi:AraC-like DNA-binding protein